MNNPITSTRCWYFYQLGGWPCAQLIQAIRAQKRRIKK